jgi:hypothetical protein
MTMTRFLPRAVLTLSVVALAACATTVQTPAGYPSAPARADAAAPAAALPDLSAALRCMDELLLDYGARDLTVVAEDLADASRKTTATKDLLIAAVSDMSRRSRAIRIVAQGAEAGASLHAARPQYVLRGSVSRHDDRTLGVGLTLMNAQDGSAVPGVASRRQMPAAPGDQALRPLVEAGTIEVFGRLAKVPYWTCLGQKPDDPAVATEIRDWYDAMATRPKEIIEYFQAQLRLRGAYAGPIDGAPNVAFNDAVARYREALGLTREPRLTTDFLQAYLGASHRELKARVAAPATVAAAPVAVAAHVAAPAAAPAAAPITAPAAQQPPTPVAPAPLAVQVAAANDTRRFDRGEAVRLTVRPTRDAHVYCFLLDENRQISRFFPNRFQRDSRVDAGVGLQLPGAMRFEIRMNAKGVQETVECFATERDVLPELPATLAASDFAPLPAASLDQLRDTFARAARGGLAHASFEVRPK